MTINVTVKNVPLSQEEFVEALTSAMAYSIQKKRKRERGIAAGSLVENPDGSFEFDASTITQTFQQANP